MRANVATLITTLLLKPAAQISLAVVLLRIFINTSQKADDYIAVMEHHRKAARDALALAQEHQVRAHNKHRHPVEEIQPGDLVTINPHTLKLVDGTGLGVKLVQKPIGPFVLRNA
ncbi:hypothetical protein B0H14DRAFT_3440957 [Mycena olivaceomarginata]|nr:hypothetical protein B0H14DRAFT_3440957 [Mycena olivaceomarginata]